jgi:hypothetical protein
LSKYPRRWIQALDMAPGLHCFLPFVSAQYPDPVYLGQVRARIRWSIECVSLAFALQRTGAKFLRHIWHGEDFPALIWEHSPPHSFLARSTT